MSTSPGIVFISRAYPPVIGGIERQNYELHRALEKRTRVELIANTRGKRFLPLFFFVALFRGIWAAGRNDVILLGDGVLAPLGWLLGVLCRKPVCCVIHGLDVTFTNSFYQAVWVRFAMPRLDRLFAVGNETISQAQARGIPGSLCSFIPNGVDVSERPASGTGDRGRVEPRGDGFYLLTLGRLVERKGVAWFLREVFPLLADNVHYWIAGDGPVRGEIEAARLALSSPDRVRVYGRVSDAEKSTLMREANMFVQPNIPVAGDMEGFGLVVLEAAMAGLPVVASRLEGLRDAISEGENGLLVEPGDAQGFARCINDLVAKPAEAIDLGRRARSYTQAHCGWDLVARLYLEEMTSVAAAAGKR